MVNHFPYSPDLSNFFLFAKLKKFLTEKRLSNNEVPSQEKVREKIKGVGARSLWYSLQAHKSWSPDYKNILNLKVIMFKNS